MLLRAPGILYRFDRLRPDLRRRRLPAWPVALVAKSLWLVHLADAWTRDPALREGRECPGNGRPPLGILRHRRALCLAGAGLGSPTGAETR